MLTSATHVEIACKWYSHLITVCKIPPQHRYPNHPPLMVKGVLVATKTMRTKTLYNDTRNEICLAANEILLRKVKSDKSDEISLREVADNRNVIE